MIEIKLEGLPEEVKGFICDLQSKYNVLKVTDSYPVKVSSEIIRTHVLVEYAKKIKIRYSKDKYIAAELRHLIEWGDEAFDLASFRYYGVEFVNIKKLFIWYQEIAETHELTHLYFDDCLLDIINHFYSTEQSGEQKQACYRWMGYTINYKAEKNEKTINIKFIF